MVKGRHLGQGPGERTDVGGVGAPRGRCAGRGAAWSIAATGEGEKALCGGGRGMTAPGVAAGGAAARREAGCLGPAEGEAVGLKPESRGVAAERSAEGAAGEAEAPSLLTL